jgi:hypothetical protein
MLEITRFVRSSYTWERREKYKRESTKKIVHSEDRGVGGRMGSEWILGRLDGWCGFSYLRIGTGGNIL